MNTKISKESSFLTPHVILRFEGLLLFFLSIFLYKYFGGSWLVFIGLFFLPDLGILGYLLGSKKGAIIYNALHAVIAPVLLLLSSLIFSMPILLPSALIWFSHIYFDRMLGFGLKYQDQFKHTHLGTTNSSRNQCN